MQIVTLTTSFLSVTIRRFPFSIAYSRPSTGALWRKRSCRRRLKIEADLFDKALEKLWIHGGAAVDYEDRVARGEQSWRRSYSQQAELRSTQIEHVIRFASCNACRMATLVGHFGDVSDKGVKCGICDFCAPESCIAQRFRALD